MEVNPGLGLEEKMVFQQKETQGNDIPENTMNEEKKKRIFWK